MPSKIDGIVLPQDLGASIGGSPEDAAKAFMKAATEGMAKVIADAVSKAVLEAAGGVGGPPPDWADLVKGCVMDLKWATPPKTAIQTTTAFAGSEPAAVGGGSFSVSIGVSGTF